MSSKVSNNTSEDKLLQSREQGLQEAIQVNSMRAHGKVLGMDTFSWANPQIDALASALTSFPFPIIWIGCEKQIKECLNNYPELSNAIETLLIQNTSELNLDQTVMKNVKNIVCIEGTKYALELMKTMKKEKCVFLFTTEGQEAKNDKKEFEQFISLFN